MARAMADSLRLWLANPREWHAHPYTIVAGFLAMAIVGVVFAAVFWIKGKYWP